ncbi:hypothetical protein HMPREF0262_01603 [Clostridium sp. ATCC 29733]|nr:hypothetical protein HMPREF0262_01603 [Clostridium sp. ATCC 29733]
MKGNACPHPFLRLQTGARRGGTKRLSWKGTSRRFVPHPGKTGILDHRWVAPPKKRAAGRSLSLFKEKKQ